MNDSENLSKLLVHLPPEVFRASMVEDFGLAIPELNKKQGKREQRKGMAAVLAALPIDERRPIEEAAERIVQLCDGVGQDVLEGFRADAFDEKEWEAFDAYVNQYERALWLHGHAPAVFEEALNARRADVLRQSAACYSGFMAPKDLSVLEDDEARKGFHEAVAEHLGCSSADVAVQVFKRLRPDAATGEDVDLYQVSVYHNLRPESVGCVEESEVVPKEIVRAACSHITYEPSNGHLEVLSKDTDGREVLARMAADALLKSPIEGETIPLKQYDYQSLAAPRNFDLAGENIAHVKVTELGYSEGEHRSLLVKIWARDAEDIYAAARSLIGPSFDFREHRLNYAKLAIRTKKIGNERARTITVVLRDDNKCNIKTKREKDRALCDRLLAKWHLLKEVGDVAAGADNALAA